MYSSPNHAQAILDVFSIAISDLVSMGLTEQEAISGLLGQASVRVDHPACLLYTSPSPRDKRQSRMPSSA